MGRGAKSLIAVAGLVMLFVVVRREKLDSGAAAGNSAPAADERTKPKFLPEAATLAAPPVRPAEEKAARIEKIRRDYEEIRTKMSADYAAAGAGFPGGLNAFLRQLALLEREIHADIALVLPPRELEDYEMSESSTGKILRQRLAGHEVPDEVRRAVFRLKREFDERFALVFDVSPGALVERERVQQSIWEKIRVQVGAEVFAALVQPDDPSFPGLRELGAQRGWADTMVEDLWRVKNEYVLRKLEIAAQPGLTAEQRAAMRAALVAQTRSRVVAVTGPDVLVPGSAAFGWLPAATQ